MTGRADLGHVVAGVGMSSQATAAEVGALVDQVLGRLGLGRGDVSAYATRDRFRADERLPLGAPIVGVGDDRLTASSARTERTVGIDARVAETAALLTAELLAGGHDAVLLASTERSAHATVAVAVAPTAGSRSDRLPPIGPHGGDGRRIAAELGLDPASIIDLSASMNPFAPDVAALIRDEVGRLGAAAVTSYPDATQATLVLADAMGIDAARLVLTNGGAEAIALVAAQQPKGFVLEPEFSLYARHLAHLDSSAPRWRSNPSNPLGQLADPDDIAGVWDEAFYPLATGSWTRGDDRSWRLGSLTKLWNCPGLRLGYVIAPDAESAQAIRRRQPRWAVNGLALAVLPRLLESTDLDAWQRGIAELRGELVGGLRSLGFSVTDTCVNWVLVDRPMLRASLAAHGIAVRDCSTFGMVGIHRVALPRIDEMERVLAAFAAVGPS